VRKHKNLINASNYDELLYDLKNIHMSKDEEEYKDNLNAFKSKYSIKHKDMYDYIMTEWIDRNDHRCNWQIFRNKAGLANTNSPIESFNNTIKKIFFKRNVLSIGGAIDKLDEIILYYSNDDKVFTRQPKFIKKSYELALTLNETNFLAISKSKVIYTGKNHTYKLNLNDENNYKKCSCNCNFFLKDGICMHLIAYCWLKNKNCFLKYPNPNLDSELATLNKRGRHKKTAKCGQFN